MNLGEWARVAGIALLLGASTTVNSTEPMRGRPVAQVLDEAIRAGIQLIYSSVTVPADLTVRDEPHAAQTLERLREILAPHGLALRPGIAGIWLVVRVGVATSAPEPTTNVRGPESAEDIVVAGTRYTLRAENPADGFSLADQDIQRQPALLDDPLRAIRRFPGTAGTIYSSRTHVRGGAENDNLILLDGVPLREPFRRVGQPADLSLIDAASVDRVDFFPGVFPADYGGRLSSVTRLEARRADRPLGGQLGIGFVTASALLEGQRGGGATDWLVTARRSTLDGLPRAIEPDIGHPKLFDLFVSAHQQLAPGWRGTFGALAATDDAEVAEVDGTESGDLQSDRLHAWIGVDGDLGRVALQTRLAFENTRSQRTGTIDDEDGASGALLDARQIRTLLFIQSGRVRFEGGSLRFGWQAGHTDADYNYHKAVAFSPAVIEIFGVEPQSRFDIETGAGSREFAGFLAGQWNWSERLTSDIGVRFEHTHYDTEQTFSRVDPRLSFSYRLSARDSLHWAWGNMSQFALGAELPVERATARYDAPARGELWLLGWNHAFAGGGLLRGEIYQRQIDRPWPHLESLINPLVVNPELRPDQILLTPISVRATGLDLYATGDFSEGWTGWLSYSLSRVTDRIAGATVPRSWDQRHAITAGLSTDRWGWRWSGTLTAHSGWPTTALRVADAGAVTVEPRNRARLPWYATLDLKAQREIALRYGALRLTAELTNATNRRNVCCASLDFANSDAPPSIDLDYWLPIFPLLQVVWTF
jgi:TonB dependent receptor/TonB-dependent Receptor Plug Domain